MIRKNLAFFIPFFIWMICGAVVLLLFTKSEIHLYLNRFHSGPADFFFRWITDLGDGIFAVTLIIILLFFSFGKAFLTGVAIAFSTIITQFLKRIVFFEVRRPSEYFKGLEDITIRYVPEVHLYGQNSFPSGHSNTAFCLFLCLAIFSRSHALKFFWFVIAFLAAYSRVYLSQHFFVDIYFGSIFAIVITLSTFHLFEHKLEPLQWPHRSLITRRRSEDPNNLMRSKKSDEQP